MSRRFACWQTNKQKNMTKLTETNLQLLLLNTRQQQPDITVRRRRRCQSGVWFPARAINIACSRVSAMPWGTSSLESNGSCFSLPALKRPGHEAENWPPSAVEVNNEWSCTAPIRLHRADRNKHTCTNNSSSYRSIPHCSALHRVFVQHLLHADRHTAHTTAIPLTLPTFMIS